MGNCSRIEWTQSTWNPVTGCTKVSDGCRNCYAERFAFRLKAMGNPRYKNGFKVTLHNDMVKAPLTWNSSNLVFVNSMSDLFHEAVPTSFIKAIFNTMMNAPHHTFQVLTKRTKRLTELSRELPWTENMWVGVSVETQDYVWRVEDLRPLPANVKFISCEPFLGPLEMNLKGIDWVIAGGESGPHARPMKTEWLRSLKDQTRFYDVPFFFKQWGGIRNKRGHENAILDGSLYKEWPLDGQNKQIKVTNSRLNVCPS